MAKLVKAAGALALFAIVAAGCGGDDSTAAKGTTTTASDDTTTTVSDDGGSGVDQGTDLGAILDDDCKFLVTGAFLNPLAGLAAGKGNDIKDAAGYLDAVADKAPAEIKDAMTTVAEGIAQATEILKGVDVSSPQALRSPEVAAKLGQLQAVFDQDYQDASTAVSTWITDNCR